MKRLITLLFVVSIIAGCNNTTKESAAGTTFAPSTPDEALAILLKGNERFSSDKEMNPHHGTSRMTEIAPHQNPFVAIVGCSDSRVPQELIFDLGLGDIFGIRVAGNNVNDDHVMGSVEYAVDHLGVKLVMIMGHSSCGGLIAATSCDEQHEACGKDTCKHAVNELIASIRTDIPEYVGKTDSLQQAIYKHTVIQKDRVLANPIVQKKVDKGELKVVAAFYDIKSGKVTLL